MTAYLICEYDWGVGKAYVSRSMAEAVLRREDPDGDRLYIQTIEVDIRPAVACATAYEEV